jgi:hypothetical protein
MQLDLSHGQWTVDSRKRTVAGRTTSLRLRLHLRLIPLVHVRVLVRGRELVVQHRRQLLVLWVRVDVGEMAVSPAVARGGFVLASLPLLVLGSVSECDAGRPGWSLRR